MKASEILFFTFLVIMCSMTNTFKQAPPKNSAPWGNQQVIFIADVHSEAPNGQDLYRDKGLDILKLREPEILTQLVKDIISDKAQEIKSFLSKYNLLDQGYDKLENFAFATVDEEGEFSYRYFSSIVNLIFNPTGNAKTKVYLHAKFLTESIANELITVRQGECAENFSLHMISYGFYRKTHGLNLTPDFCPNIVEGLKKRWQNENEFRTFLIMNKYDKLIDDVANQFANITFAGEFEKDIWLFEGQDKSLRTKASDLYQFLETVNFDYQSQIETQLLNDSQWDPLLKLRQSFQEFYFGSQTEFVGKRFTSFLTYIINQRANAVYNNLTPKKWLTIGSNDLGAYLLSKFLKDSLKLDVEQCQIGDSLYFVFTGVGETATDVWVFNNSEYKGTISITDFSKYAEHDIHKTEDFNTLCIGKKEVQDFSKDY